MEGGRGGREGGRSKKREEEGQLVGVALEKREEGGQRERGRVGAGKGSGIWRGERGEGEKEGGREGGREGLPALEGVDPEPLPGHAHTLPSSELTPQVCRYVREREGG